MQLKGIVKHISDQIVVGKDEKQTSKIIVCLEDIKEEERPDKIAIDFIGDKQSLVEGLEVGDVATICFGTNYNRWKGEDGNKEEKIYNSVKGWKVTIETKAKPAKEEDLPF